MLSWGRKAGPCSHLIPVSCGETRGKALTGWMGRRCKLFTGRLEPSGQVGSHLQVTHSLPDTPPLGSPAELGTRGKCPLACSGHLKKISAVEIVLLWLDKHWFSISFPLLIIKLEISEYLWQEEDCHHALCCRLWLCCSCCYRRSLNLPYHQSEITSFRLKSKTLQLQKPPSQQMFCRWHPCFLHSPPCLAHVFMLTPLMGS